MASHAPQVEADIFCGRLAGMGERELLSGFLRGVSVIAEQAVELELIDMPERGERLGVLSLLDRIDEAVHEKEEPDTDLSKKIGILFDVASKPGMEDQIGVFDASADDEGRVIYRRKIDAQAAMASFEEGRENREAEAAAAKSERKARRDQATQRARSRREQQLVRLRDQEERRQKREKEKAEARTKKLDEKRFRLLERQRKKWRLRRPEVDTILTPAQIEVLPYVHLSREESAAATGIKSGTISKRVGGAKARLGLETTEQLAIWALEHGIEYDVAEPPHVSAFTIRERQVASRLHMRYADICSSIGVTPAQVGTDVASLFEKIGTHSRGEVALIAHMYGFEPFPEEQDQIPEALQPFTEAQREAISVMFLTDAMAAAVKGVGKSSIRDAISKAISRAEVPGRFALADKLITEGYEFSIAKPKRPLHEVLTDQHIKLARSLSDALYEEIARENDLAGGEREVRNLVSYMKLKTGARTGLELYLMVKKYDDGRSKPEHHNRRPKEERFFEALGIPPVPMEEARHLLQHATPRQAEFLEAYYFSGNEGSWRDVAKQLNVVKQAARRAGADGLRKIRAHLEEHAPVK